MLLRLLPDSDQRDARQGGESLVAIICGDSGYDSREALLHCKKRGVRTIMPVHVAKRLGLAAKYRLDWDIDKVDGE